MRRVVIAVAAVLFVSTAAAEIPQVMGYQGRVTDNSGNPVADGNYTMRFRIYDNAGGSGSPLWDSGNRTVSVGGGVFSVMLGESPQPALGLPFDQDYWLLVTFAGQNQAPLRKLASVGYAYMASGLVPGTNVIGSVVADAVIDAQNTAGAGASYGLRGRSSSTAGVGVYGEASATSGYTCGVYGITGPGANGTGVFGQGNWRGVYGVSTYPTGVGVYAEALATAGDARAVFAESKSSNGQGVCGYASATDGVTRGVYGRSNSMGGTGVYGWASATTSPNYGVFGVSSSTWGTGVCGTASATTDVIYGVSGWTSSPSGYAGYFGGDVHVNGTLTKWAGSFLIDHPLDPENKLLRHNFVESPENLLIYRGKVRLDAAGEAAVQMPEYFEALTKEDEASIHLSPAGKPFLTGAEWSPGFHVFAVYGEPNRSVFWEVLAERDDPVMRQLARSVEEEKGPDNKYCDRGKLLHPTAYGYPESMGRDYERHERDRQQMEEDRARREREVEKVAVLQR